jgi:hypothetical protein
VIFANTAEIAAWIRQHGGDFETFRRNHPAAVRLLNRPQTTPAHRTRPARSSASVTPPRTAAAAGGSSTNGVALAVTASLAGLLLLLALAPMRLLARLRLPQPENRIELLFVRGAAAVSAALVVALGA